MASLSETEVFPALSTTLSVPLLIRQCPVSDGVRCNRCHFLDVSSHSGPPHTTECTSDHWASIYFSPCNRAPLVCCRVYMLNEVSTLNGDTGSDGHAEKRTASRSRYDYSVYVPLYNTRFRRCPAGPPYHSTHPLAALTNRQTSPLHFLHQIRPPHYPFGSQCVLDVVRVEVPSGPRV